MAGTRKSERRLASIGRINLDRQRDSSMIKIVGIFEASRGVKSSDCRAACSNGTGVNCESIVDTRGLKVVE